MRSSDDCRAWGPCILAGFESPSLHPSTIRFVATLAANLGITNAPVVASARVRHLRNHPPGSVMLIALGGLPAVGKSALAMALARRTGAVHLRIDTIEQAMRNAGITVSGPEGYHVARDLAKEYLHIGHTVIVDSVNPVAITRGYWHETATCMKVELLEVEVVCSDKRQHRQRVESRVSDIPGLVLPNWQQVRDRHYEPWKTAHVIDTAGCTLEETVARAEAILRSNLGWRRS